MKKQHDLGAAARSELDREWGRVLGPLTALGLNWQRVRGSLWFLPGIMSLGAVVLAVVCGRLDEMVTERAELGILYRGDADSARTLLATIAGSMVTVAGVSFSVTMVALSLASSQLGPRLLTNFMRDPGNQLVLGGFISTFLFCLLALSSIAQEAGERVSVSATVALVLAVGSLILLIYFIHHIATSMQADYVVESVAHEVGRSLRTLFPAEPPNRPTGAAELVMAADACAVASSRTGYLQSINEPALLELAVDHDLRVYLLHGPGDFIVAGKPIAQLAGPGLPDEAIERKIRAVFFIGGKRTPEQDPEYGLRQLVEIALRALSPSLNDPFTAMACIDHLSGILASVADTAERPPLRWDHDGNPRIRVHSIDFAGLLDAAFNQIRQNARGTPSVSIRLLEALHRIATATHDPERLAAVEAQARMIYGANAELLADRDRAAFEERCERLKEALGGEFSRG